MVNLDSIDKNMPVLVVDDMSTMRKMVRVCLKKLGFENVTEAEDGEIALEKLEDGEFKLIISDWNMPNMMGIDLLKIVRKNEKWKSIPFLMVTAEAQKDNIREATKEGVTNYIIKPLTPQVLQSKLEAIFSEETHSPQ